MGLRQSECQRGEFHSYHHCYEAAQSEIASLGPECAGIAWQQIEMARGSAKASAPNLPEQIGGNLSDFSSTFGP
jgi:hypothetical protein